MLILVVIQIVNQHGVTILERKSQSPVSADSDRKVPRQITGQSVESPSWRIHVFGNARNFQTRKLPSKPRRMARHNASPAAGFVVALEAFVPEGSDHSLRFSV
jgi:hypothetical protein